MNKNFDFAGTVVRQGTEGDAIPFYMTDPAINPNAIQTSPAPPPAAVAATSDVDPPGLNPAGLPDNAGNLNVNPGEPIVPNGSAQAAPNPEPGALPKPDDSPDLNLEDLSTFGLTALALQDAGILPEDFPIKETNDANLFVNNLKASLEAQIQKGVEARIQEFEDYKAKIDFLEKGGPEEVLRKVAPLNNLINYDYTQETPDSLELKEHVIAIALRLKGNEDLEIQTNLKAYHENKLFDSKFEQSLQEVTAYRDQIMNDAKAHVEAVQNKENAAKEEKSKLYNQAVSNILNTGLIGTFKIPEEDMLGLREAVINQKADVIQYKENDQVKSVKVSKLVKFLNEVNNNPEKQLLAFYYYNKGYENVNHIILKNQRAAGQSIIQALESRMGKETPASNKGGVPMDMNRKFIGQV